MKNIHQLLFAVAVTSTLVFSSALPARAYSGECVSLTQNLSYGLQDVYTNGEIALLQQFLINQGFLTSVSAPTGFFGYGTQNAVASYQSSRGLPATGSVGQLTISSIEGETCGSPTSGGPAWIIGDSSTTNMTTQCAQGDLFNRVTGQLCSTNNTSNISGCFSGNLYSTTTGQLCYPNTSGLNITNMNAPSVLNVGVSGTWSFAVNGSNNGYLTTSVRWGDEGTYYTTLSSQPTYLQNGQTISFTHAYQTTGVYTPVFTVTDSLGRQGSASQTVTIAGSNYYGVPTITSITPNTASAGSTVTIYGSGFGTQTANTIYFGTTIFSNRYSSDGTSLNFIIPSTSQTCFYQTTCGTYSVYVTNAQGQSSNSVQFVVTGTSSGSAPSISSLTGPTSLAVGTSGLWSFVVTTNASYLTTSVRWGDESYYGGSVSPSSTLYTQGQQSRTFTHTYQTPGSYTVIFTVVDSQGLQSTASATVNVTGTIYNGQTILSYLSPTQGRIGTQVTLQGSGFSTYGNTVRFGIGGSVNLSSNNGSTIYYTIPSVVTPCDTANGSICSMIAQQVTSGTSYPIYVINSSGQTTGTLYFLVTQ
ncbi:MAG: peptidoglycan-binding protein [Candidatus Pacebacteria bacterium]|nr:peptidoglycan-binding protein [Candidatus Paceibacterota bacterium]